jgi:hypothetical protein
MAQSSMGSYPVSQVRALVSSSFKNVYPSITLDSSYFKQTQS